MTTSNLFLIYSLFFGSIICRHIWDARRPGIICCDRETDVMRNIRRIFVSDIKDIKSSVFLIIICGALCILPALYAWFNIYSNWDPYGSTSGIKIAVASEDEGYTMDDGTYNNVGDTVLDGLRESTSIGWVFLDSEQDAVDGVYAGDYYAAICIDPDFSYKMYNFLNGKVEDPHIEYYNNEKKNGVGTKITDTAASKVQATVNKAFVDVLVELVFERVNAKAEELIGEDWADTVIDKMVEMRAKLADYDRQLGEYAVSTADMSSQVYADVPGVITASQGAIASLESVSYALDDLKLALDDFYTADATGIVNSQIMEYCRALTASSAGTIGASSQTLSASAGIFENLPSIYEGAGGSLASTSVILTQIRSRVQILEKKMDELLAKVNDPENADKVEMLLHFFMGNAEAYAEFLSEPVHTTTIEVYPVDNYGSAMAPFYTVLALWVGALVLFAMISPNAENVPGLVEPTALQLYFGRFMILILMGQIQTAVIVLGDLYLLKIQCLHPLLFWASSAAINLTFTFLIYSLVLAFGDVGKAIAVVLVVIQIAGSSGTFPIELLPEIFKKIYVFFPFPYAINALRETIAGIYETDLAGYLGELSVFGVVGIGIGLFLRRPFIKINAFMEERMKDTRMM